MSNMPSKLSNSRNIVELYSSSEDLDLDLESEQCGKRKKQINLNAAGPANSSGFGGFEDLYFDAGSPPVQSCQDEIVEVGIVKFEDSEIGESEKQKAEKFNLDSLGLLKNYGYRFRHLKGEKIEVAGCGVARDKGSECRVSTDAIIRQAGESFINSSVKRCNGFSDASQKNKLVGLSDEEAKDVELVGNLLAAAEKVGQKKLRRARKLLKKCSEWAGDEGNPVQRLVYYFAAALSEKIDYHIGRDMSKSLEKKVELLDFEESVMSQKSANIAFLKEVPFAQVSQFTGVQAIIEHVAEATRVHIIDFFIMNGSNCIVLLQALAARDENPIEHLRITAVGTKSQERLEETGQRLMTFAESVNLPFSFNLVMVADMLDLNEGLFKLNAEEVVVVQSSYLFSTLISKSDRLEYVMRVIRDINPSVMVMIENEGNHNSSVFVKRFVEALFYYGAFFDCIEDCMERSNPDRLLVELIHFSPAIQNIVVADGEDRITRQVDMSVWREFFKRFMMVELDLSKSSLYHARLIVNKFACGSSCTLDRDGKCLIIGWKGTPIHSLSAWKFE
ncbi:hypothetical protein ACET3Z_029803 [Daucus carota]